jgi:uncharacterized membrane protein YgcG
MANYTNKQVIIPPFVSGDVSGVTFGGFAVDKYICSQPDATPAEGSANVAHSGAAGAVPGLSKAGVPVWDYITFPQAMIAAANKGKGWHLITAFEWASLAFLAKKLSANDTRSWPGGGNANSDPPADILTATEIALLDKHLHAENAAYHRALPGTGPKGWSHNHAANGVFDLQGLVYQWVMGLFIGAAGVDGHPEVLASLDCTYTGSPYGRGTISNSGGNPPVLTVDGAGVNWLKQWGADAFNGMSVYIAEAAGGAGAFYAITDTTATTLLLTNGDAPGNGTATFCIVKHIATDISAGCTSGQKILTLRDADADLKGFAIPATTDGTGASGYGNDYYYFDKTALRAALRGGAFNNAAVAGVFCLHVDLAPSTAYYDIGFRACKAL